MEMKDIEIIINTESERKIEVAENESKTINERMESLSLIIRGKETFFKDGAFYKNAGKDIKQISMEQFQELLRGAKFVMNGDNSISIIENGKETHIVRYVNKTYVKTVNSKEEVY